VTKKSHFPNKNIKIFVHILLDCKPIGMLCVIMMSCNVSLDSGADLHHNPDPVILKGIFITAG